MHDWLRRMEAMGITSARLHVLEVEGEDVRKAYALSTEENMTAFMSFAELEKELTTLHLDLFNDLRNLLMGIDDETTCVWNACDPYTTRPVRGVEGQGQSSNCGRTNKDGIDFVKSSQEGFERYIALYNTPQEQGGCSGCRFFLMCKGQCPGTAIDGDWRNPTEHCDLWKGLFREMEEQFLEAARRRSRRAPSGPSSKRRSSKCGLQATPPPSPARGAGWSSAGRTAIQASRPRRTARRLRRPLSPISPKRTVWSDSDSCFPTSLASRG